MSDKQYKAIFIDKDGTLIPDIPYNVNPALITLQEGAVDGLKFLQAEGFLLIVVSNQAGVAHGYFEEQDLEAVKKIEHLLLAHSIFLNGFYYCPHHPNGTIQGYITECACRKPKPGMIIRAAKDLNINVSASWMIGDILNDVEAGLKAGCRSVLIDNGNETEWILNEWRKPDYVACNINDAANFILQH